MRLLIALSLVSACGRFGFDQTEHRLDAATGSDDASIDAPPACTSFSPWSAPQTVALINSIAIDWGPHLSKDQLTLYFASMRNSSNDRLYATTRDTLTSDWKVPALVQVSGGEVAGDDPSTSANELELYWGTNPIRYATRTTIGDAWVNQGNAMITSTGFSVDGGPDLSDDGLTIMFTGTDASTTVWHQYQSTRPAIGAAWTAATPLQIAQTATGEAYGSWSGDILDVISSSQTGPSRLFEATRASATDAFSPAIDITELDAAGIDNGDPDLSADHLTVWFGSTRAGGVGDRDLWFSTRTCL